MYSCLTFTSLSPICVGTLKVFFIVCHCDFTCTPSNPIKQGYATGVPTWELTFPGAVPLGGEFQVATGFEGWGSIGFLGALCDSLGFRDLRGGFNQSLKK